AGDPGLWLYAVGATLPILITALIVAFAQGREVTDRVDRLARRADSIARRELDMPVLDPTGDEIARVALGLERIRLSVVRMTQDVAQRGRIEAELTAVQDVKDALAPTPAPGSERFDIASSYRPSAELGGDWYAWLPGAGQRLYLVLGDVTGHGAPSALVAASCRSATSALVRRDRVGGVATLTPARLLEELNAELRSIASGRYSMTCLVAQLDLESGRLSVAAAANPRPILVRHDGNSTVLNVAGPVLGAEDTPHYDELEALLNAGDTLLLFTDGLIEARDDQDREFGLRRLMKAIEEREPGASAEQLVDHLNEAVAVFQGESQTTDDMTLAVVHARIQHARL
ncbi:MAG: sigma-B regulation protein RsbU (phosphoserine phosphatase), partial [Myxococcota bacterium]